MRSGILGPITRLAFGFVVPALLALAGLPAGAWAGDHDATVGSGSEFSPQFSLHGFSDMVLRTQRARIPSGGDSTSSSFALGQFDLYFVSRLADNLSFLGESVFELGPDGETAVDVERVFLKYGWSDLVSLAVGRTHTALGYWNAAFHHGALLQPTVERPEALKFEDDGGILPVHSVGLEMSGGWHAGPLGINYVANLANGRGPNREAVQGGGDLNRDKAVSLKLSLVVDGALRIETGPGFYRDRIPADPGTPGRENEIGERIPGAHLHLSTPAAVALAEYYRVRHEDLGTGAVWNHDAWYAIVIRAAGRVRPYAGFDRLDFDAGDPFYAPDDRDLSRAIAGLRFEPDPFNALKLEYRHDWRPGGRTHELLVQTAFTF